MTAPSATPASDEAVGDAALVPLVNGWIAVTLRGGEILRFNPAAVTTPGRGYPAAALAARTAAPAEQSPELRQALGAADTYALGPLSNGERTAIILAAEIRRLEVAARLAPIAPDARSVELTCGKCGASDGQHYSSCPPPLARSVDGLSGEAEKCDASLPEFYVEESDGQWRIYRNRMDAKGWVYNFGWLDNGAAEIFANGICKVLNEHDATIRRLAGAKVQETDK